jgi:hypothetical protein
VINLGSILVGNATLVVANVLTCNKHSPQNWTLNSCYAIWQLMCNTESAVKLSSTVLLLKSLAGCHKL